DVVDDRPVRPILAAACFALVAAGLDPPILDPSMPSIQAAIRSEPQIQSLLLVTALWKAAVLLAGGVIADIFRSNRMLTLGLIGLVVASALAIIVPDGPAFLASRLMATLSVGIVIPFVVGAVGSSYSGIKRATAIGIAYAALAAGSALAAPLALLNGVNGPFTAAFVVCGVTAAIAALGTWRLLPPMPHAPLSQRPLILATALWAFGVTAIVAALINFRIDALDVLVAAVGLAAIVIATLSLRRRGFTGISRIELRPVAIVLAVGIVLGFAQIVPLIKLPQYFVVVQGLPPIVATAAIAPFVVALLIAGPVSGWLLQRVGPRLLIGGGVAAVGAADLLLAAILWPDTNYVLFIVPFVLIGAGFVIATVVRTSLIFASVPKQLPGTAAALNEASLGLGSRLGVVFSTAIVTQVALRTYADALVGQPAEEIARRLEPLREILFALGLPEFPELLELIESQARADYVDAALAGARVAFIVPGVLAIITGVVAFVALGRRGPMRTVWEHMDERVAIPDPASTD
ncbi:MAG TPA: MFS transporter, partial [Candidatus Limnocylindrales bacterium]|nr:MFS transporter [Candidatus Limnocylindrales bacterium]